MNNKYILIDNFVYYFFMFVLIFRIDFPKYLININFNILYIEHLVFENLRHNLFFRSK